MKRIFALSLALCLLLAGCGREEAPETAQASAAPTDAPAQTAEAPATADTGPEGVLEDKATQTVYLLTRMSALDGSGSPVWYREYAYDAGLLSAEFEYNSNDDLSYRKEYTYNGAGLCTEIHTFYLDPEDPSVISEHHIQYCTYDGAGRLILQETYVNEVLNDRTECTYDDRGNYLTCKLYFGSELAYDWSYTYEYDAGGNILTREEFLEGELAYTFRASYDAQGRCTESTTTLADGTVEVSCVMAWEGDTETRTYYDMENQVFLLTVSTYDEQGNLTFQENRYTDGSVVTTEYFYEPFEITK